MANTCDDCDFMKESERPFKVRNYKPKFDCRKRNKKISPEKYACLLFVKKGLK